MEQKDKENSKVVSLFGSNEQKNTPNEEANLDGVIKKNEEIREKLKKERIQANRSVLRSYKIKN